MSFFDKIFGGKEETKEQKSFWNIIKSEDDLKIALESSNTGKIAIFKHSTSCFISKTVLKHFEKEIENHENIDEVANLYFLDLLAYRPLSNKIAEDLGIRHESPQLLVIEDGKVINDASHQNISINQLS